MTPCCTEGELDGSSVVTKLLEIQQFAAPNQKSAAWIENLRCLLISLTGELQFIDRSKSVGGDQEYIAVSYSWAHTPNLECDRSGKYRILDHEGHYLRNSLVRDEVLSRVMCYAKHLKISQLWIDRECSPQGDSEETQVAVNSMDLVYRDSAYPVGLLAIKLETQDEVDHLQNLMTGQYIVQCSVDEPPRLKHPASSQVSQFVFALLQHIYPDRWWTRAWIFQEEYLSSTAMRLLIRCNTGVAARGKFGILQGEVCINAADFRKQATLFLLAFQRDPAYKSCQVCATMLERFGKYNVQCLFQDGARGRAMSPRVFADIERRQITKPFDRIPIAANICDYPIRLESQRLSKSNYSVGICLLAMYLLNGEVLRTARCIEKLPTEMDITQYLGYISFDMFDPPTEEKHLSYVKKCRLQDVSFCRQGVMTNGYLWTIECTLPTTTWPRRYSCRKKYSKMGLNKFQRSCLYQLSDQLQYRDPTCRSLRRRILSYLEQDKHPARLTETKEHMDVMADEVVEAIRTGERLYIASICGSAEACGVFVGLENPKLGVFTSWHADIDADGRSRQTHVSLEVEIEEAGGVPLLTNKQWVNGLVFFNQHQKEPVIFQWPHAWTRTFGIPRRVEEDARSMLPSTV